MNDELKEVRIFQLVLIARDCLRKAAVIESNKDNRDVGKQTDYFETSREIEEQIIERYWRKWVKDPAMIDDGLIHCPNPDCWSTKVMIDNYGDPVLLHCEKCGRQFELPRDVVKEHS